MPGNSICSCSTWKTKREDDRRTGLGRITARRSNGGVTLPLTAEGQKRGKNGGNKRREEEGLKCVGGKLWKQNGTVSYKRWGKGEERVHEPEGRLAGSQRSVVLHLCLRYDGFLPWLGAEEGGERGCNHKRVRPDEAAQVTARDCVLFCLKHQSVHSIKLAPRQPHGALLAQERGALEPQCQ